MRRILSILLILALAGWFSGFQVITGKVGAPASPYEDFSNASWVEVDPNSHITKADGDNYTISFAGLARNEDAYVYKDFGSAYFSGDFTHLIDIYHTDTAYTYGMAHVWGVSNTVDDRNGWVDGIFIYMYNDTGSTTYRLRVEEIGGSYDQWTSATLDTAYYLRIARDDDGGTGTGQIVVKVYTTASDRDNDTGSNLADTLTLNLAAQTDFQYLYALCTYNDGSGTYTSGWVKNLDIGE